MRATLSQDKKYELAFASLTHKFLGETGKNVSILKFKPMNALNLDGFYEKAYVTDATEAKTAMLKQKNLEQLEMNLLNTDSIEQLTGTKNGKGFLNDYRKQQLEEVQKGTGTFESAFHAFRDQVLVMYTAKAQKNLFKAFTNNLTNLQEASILDKAFMNEAVKDLFPEVTLQVEAPKAVKAVKTEEINA